jgi:hypothetical protein
MGFSFWCGRSCDRHASIVRAGTREEKSGSVKRL